MPSNSYNAIQHIPYIHRLLSGVGRGRLATRPFLSRGLGGRVLHHPGVHLHAKLAQDGGDVLQDLVYRLTALFRGSP